MVARSTVLSYVCGGVLGGVMSERVLHTLAIGCPMRWPRMECGMPASEGGPHDFVTGRRAVTCPGCKAVVDKDPVETFGAPAAMSAYVDWANGDDSGISSKALLSAITGVNFLPHPWSPHPPSDCWDFGRCYRLVECFPELREKLHVVVEKQPQWSHVITHWPELSAIYEKMGGEWSEEMYAILKGGEP